MYECQYEDECYGVSVTINISVSGMNLHLGVFPWEAPPDILCKLL